MTEASMSFDVFISHARADLAVAERIERFLSDAGFRVFVDLSTLASGASFAEELSRVVKASSFVLVLLSRSYTASRWAEQELRMAMDQEVQLDAGDVKVIPVLLDDCDIPELIRGKRAVDLRVQDRFSEELGRLARDLRSLAGHHERGTPLSAEVSGRRSNARDEVASKDVLSRLGDKVRAFAEVPASGRALAGESSTAGRRVCFVVMPFGREDLNVVYEDFVRPVLETSCALSVVRGDDLFGSNVVMDDIRSSIAGAAMVLADLTGKNANVFYEVGIAHTLDVPVLLLAQSMDDVPFDLRHRRVLVYEYSPRGCKKLESALANHVRETIGDSRTKARSTS